MNVDIKISSLMRLPSINHIEPTLFSAKKSTLPFLAAYINSDDVIYDINQGKREIGKATFTQFMACMNFNYKEQLIDMVVMASANGLRAAAEFVVLGEYIKTDEDLPAANGEKYKLPAGAFF